MYKTIYTKAPSNKRLVIERHFSAPVNLVWKAWTDPAILDQWWAPKPYHTETKEMDFRIGGRWLYSMHGPDNEGLHYAVALFEKIDPGKSFSIQDAFCDEHGNLAPDFPVMHWDVTFISQGDHTKVEIIVDFPTPADLDRIVEMGFQDGFAAAHDNLEGLFLEEAVSAG